jgi:predicted nucleic acid-binding protein
VTKLDDALIGVQRLGLDTAPIIYFVEAHPRYDAVMTEVFRRVRRRRLLAVTSLISLAEVLVLPILRNDARLQGAYERLLTTTNGFRTRVIRRADARRAAALRARHGLKLPDSLQISVAIEAGCDAFLTNDRALQRVTELPVLVLDDLEL